MRTTTATTTTTTTTTSDEIHILDFSFIEQHVWNAVADRIGALADWTDQRAFHDVNVEEQPLQIVGQFAIAVQIVIAWLSIWNCHTQLQQYICRELRSLSFVVFFSSLCVTAHHSSRSDQRRPIELSHKATTRAQWVSTDGEIVFGTRYKMNSAFGSVASVRVDVASMRSGNAALHCFRAHVSMLCADNLIVVL
jgi:hypothetical protein